MPFPIFLPPRLQPYRRVFALLIAMLLGAAVPQTGALSPLVQYLLMVMLFFAFLDMQLRPQALQKGVLWVLLANLAMAVAAYLACSLVDHELALAAFITASAPTAIAATVFVSFLGGRIDFVAAAVLLTNVVTAVFIPFALPFVLGADTSISTWGVLQPVLITMFVPLVLARLALLLPTPTLNTLRTGRRLSFPLWLCNLFIICAKASAFIRSDAGHSWAMLGQIALVSLLICAANFTLGALLGGRHHWQESSQSLGQKNTSFVIWIALAFINPLAAMGPTFYVVYHNLYNAWQLYRYEQQRR